MVSWGEGQRGLSGDARRDIRVWQSCLNALISMTSHCHSRDTLLVTFNKPLKDTEQGTRHGHRPSSSRTVRARWLMRYCAFASSFSAAS